MKGNVKASLYSYGCLKAKRLGISNDLKDYVLSGGEEGKEKEIIENLKKLNSYLYYEVIAIANDIEDPLNEQVVDAHWKGNSLLDKVRPIHVSIVANRGETKTEKELRVVILKPIIDNKSAHHNSYAHLLQPGCSVIIKGDNIYHLGIKKEKATPEDKRNLEIYGRIK